jgi:hypothetical protein
MVGSRIALILMALICLWPAPCLAVAPSESALAQRLAAWPAWTLPAPLSRPGRGDLLYPEWFSGTWWLYGREEGASQPIAPCQIRFLSDGHGAVVGDRAFNAARVGEALLGDQLLAVANDPANPNRQVARLRGDLELESTVVGRRSERGELFLADELALQVLHGPGGARISRVETLSRYRSVSRDPGSELISAEQWQASYPSPEQGLVARATGHHHLWLMLSRRPPAPWPGLPAGEEAH